MSWASLATGTLSFIRQIGWALLSSLIVIGGYLLAAALIYTLVPGVLTQWLTVWVNLIVVVAVAAVRYLRPYSLDYLPMPPSNATHLTGPELPMVIATVSVGFVAGQSTAAWLYSIFGSSGFEHVISERMQLSVVALLMTTVIVAPVAEEMLFRGLLVPIMRRHTGFWISMVVTVAGFALMHANLVQAVTVVPLAVTLTVLYERTRTLAPVIWSHLGFNVAALLIPPMLITIFANGITVICWWAAFVVLVVLLRRRWASAPDEQHA